MPRRALRCVAEIHVHSVTCPGVWLPIRNDIYLCVSLWGQYRRTQLTGPLFPLEFNETFRFDKVFYTAFEPTQVAAALEEHDIIVELVQLSDIYQGGKLLASYSCDARNFLYPYPSYSATYGTTDRELLMERTLDFPGIAPKMEFSTSTTIRETHVPLADPYDDEAVARAVDNGRKSRARSKSVRPLGEQRAPLRHRRPTLSSIARSRSPSPVSGLWRTVAEVDDVDYDDLGDEIRPPFVVRKTKSDLIGRTPGFNSNKNKSKKKKQARSASPARNKGSSYVSSLFQDCILPFNERNCTVCRLYHRYTGRHYTGHKCAFTQAKPVGIIREGRTLDEELNVDGLLADELQWRYGRNTTPPPLRTRARPKSPLIYRPTLSARYGSDAVYRSPSPYRHRGVELDTMDELELDLELARRRRALCCKSCGKRWLATPCYKCGYYMCTFDRDPSWADPYAPSEICEPSHRVCFDDQVEKHYQMLYDNTKRL